MWEWIINFLYECIHMLEGFVGDWGLAIIIFTIIIRVLLLPLTLKQQRSMADMQVVAPMLQEIQTKYADDPQRLNEEMMKFYSEHKFNPLAGCLPMLIQMPVFFALFSVLRERVPESASFYDILPDLTANAGGVLGSAGILAAIPYIIFVLLFGILTFLPMFLQQNGTNNSMTKGMAAIMTVMMLFVGWSSPAGVVLYWVASSGWGVAQQQIIFKRKKIQVEAEQAAQLATKPVEVDVVRKVKKPRPKKKH